MKDFIYRSIRSIYILFVVISFSSCSYSILVSINNCSNDVYELKFKLNKNVTKNKYICEPFYVASFNSVEDINYDLDWKKITWKDNFKDKDFFEIDLKPGVTIRLESASNSLSRYKSEIYEYIEIINLSSSDKMVIECEMLRSVLELRWSGLLGKPYAFLNLK